VILSDGFASLEALLFVTLLAAALHKQDRKQDDQQATTNTDQNPLPVIKTGGWLTPWVHTNRKFLVSDVGLSNRVRANKELSGLADINA